MEFRISRREVLNNLIRFKNNLLETRTHRKSDPKERSQPRVYKVLLNCRTGDMQFAQKILHLETHLSKHKKDPGNIKDWKEVHLTVKPIQGKGIHCEMKDFQGRDLKESELAPVAWKIAKETVQVLNQKGKHVQSSSLESLPEEAALQDLSSIYLGSLKEKIEDLPGWFGSIDRLEAETILSDQPEGTYLFRDADETAARIAFEIGEANRLSVYPYLFTLVEKQKKISDYLVLQTDKGWVFYEDDPNLKDSYYQFRSSPQDLLHSLGSKARHPMSR